MTDLQKLTVELKQQKIDQEKQQLGQHLQSKQLHEQLRLLQDNIVMKMQQDKDHDNIQDNIQSVYGNLSGSHTGEGKAILPKGQKRYQSDNTPPNDEVIQIAPQKPPPRSFDHVRNSEH